VTGCIARVGCCIEIQHLSADSNKKQTQPNPLRLSSIDSCAYLTFEKSKPIEAKSLISSHLKRKKALFSENMDQRLSSLSPISQKRTPKQGAVSEPKLGNETGMSFNLSEMVQTATFTIPDLCGMGILPMRRKSCSRIATTAIAACRYVRRQGAL